MSKAYRSNDRMLDHDIKRLRRVFSKIDDCVALPRSLHADVMRHKLEGITPDGLHIRKSLNAKAFLKHRILSFQSVVSYALAFVLIVAVAYSMRTSTPDLVDGNIAIRNSSSPGAPDAAATAETFAASQSTQTDDVTADATADVLAPEVSLPEDHPVADSVAAAGDEQGMGGGGKAVHLGEDELYSYICRPNDRTDPDKADYPITLEIVNRDSGLLAAHIDIPDMNRVDYFFHTEDFIGLTGTGDSTVATRVFSLKHLNDASSLELLFALSQPGEYLDSRLVDNFLHVVTLHSSSDLSEINVSRLPDSITDEACVVTSVDMTSGEYGQAAYQGIDMEKRISIQNHNIYIPYNVEAEDAVEPELYMAQIKIDGVEQEMILVP